MRIRLVNLLLDPDPEGLQGGGDLGQPQVAETPTAEPQGSTAEMPQGVQGSTVSTADDPAASVAQANAAQAAEQQQAQWTSIRDAARSYGLDLSSFGDDQAALAYLAQQANQARQANYYSQIGQQLAPHAQDIRQFIEQRQQQAQPQQPQRQPWEPPQFDMRALALMERDERTGLFYAKHPGVPQELVQQANQYARWYEQFQENPAAVIQPLVEQRAAELARQTVQEELRNQQQASSVQTILQRNSSWMYATDQNGQPLRSPNGGMVPSQAGARYIHHLQQVANSGVSDPNQQDYYARQLLRAELLSAAAAQQGQQQAATAQQARAVAEPSRNTAQAVEPSRRASQPDDRGKSIQQRLREALAAEGITDTDIEQSVGV